MATYRLRFSVFMVLLFQPLHGQVEPVRLSGRLSLSSELYSSSGIAQRREKSTSRAILTPTITLYDQIVLPFEFYLTTDDRGFRQPFNQFGASPNLFGWLTLHGGYFSSRLSEFTFGDTRILGGGIEITPGRFRFSALYGRIQKGTEGDSAAGIAGQYERTMAGGKIGYGEEAGFSADLSVLHAKDDAGSIQKTAGAKPAENLAGSLAFGFPLFGGSVRLKSEIAISAFTSDTQAREVTDASGPFSSLFTSRTTTQVDGAAFLSLLVDASESFTLGVDTRWIGPGYVSLGYVQLPNDVFDVTLSPSLRLLENRLNVRTTFGVRFNNLRSNRFSTTTRTLANVLASFQATQSFGLDVQYSNYGIRSTPRNDTLRIDNINQTVSITPRYNFEGLGGMNVTSLTYSLQDFTDKNVLTSAVNGNTTNVVVLLWSLALPSTLSFTTTYVNTAVKTPFLNSAINAVTETIGYAFFDGALSTSISVGYNAIDAGSKDGQVTSGLSANYSLGKGGTFTLFVTNNNYNTDAVGGTSFGESQGSLTYSYGF